MATDLMLPAPEPPGEEDYMAIEPPGSDYINPMDVQLPEEATEEENTNPAGIPHTGVKTLHELSQESNQWCLLTDADLLKYLKQYSSNFFSKTKKVQASLDSLTQASAASEVRLNNAFNQFMMLSNSQFIENRVYDEEEEVVDEASEETTAESPTTEEEKDQDSATKAAATTVVEKYRSALGMGLQAMKLFAMFDEEKEEEEEEALDVYNERPLPFIIGTRDFLEDDTLGLGAVPDSEDDESFDSQDESSSDNDDEEEESDESEYSSDGSDSSLPASPPRSSAPPPPRQHLPPPDSEDGSWSSDDDGSSSDESSVVSPPPTRLAPPTLPPLPAKEEDDEEEDADDLFGVSSLPIKHPIVQNTAPAKSVAPSTAIVWSDEEDEEEEDLFANPRAKAVEAESSYGGLFGDDDNEKKSANLFAPEDLGDSLFTATRPSSIDDSEVSSPVIASPKPSRSLEHQISARNMGNAIFGNDDDDSDVSSPPNSGFRLPPPHAMVMTSEQPEKSLESNLFGEDDGDSQLFGGNDDNGGKSNESSSEDVSPPKNQVEPLQLPAANAAKLLKGPSSGLFGMGDDDDDDSENWSEEEESDNASSSVVSGLFGSQGRAPSLEKKPSGLFGAAQTSRDTIKQSSIKNLLARAPTQSKKGLFDDDDDEEEESSSELFAAAQQIEKKTETKNRLFDDDSEEDEAAAPSLGGTSNLFGGEIKPPVIQPAPAVLKPSSDSVTTPSTSLFGSEIQAQDPVVLHQPAAVSNEESSDDGWKEEDDSSAAPTSNLFGDIIQAAPAGVLHQAAEESSDSEGDWEDSTTAAAAPVAAPTQASLFGSASTVEDRTSSGLFGEIPTSLPSSNLFGEASSTKNEKIVVPSPMVVVPPRQPVDSSDSDDDGWSDEEDDNNDDDTMSLFGTSSGRK